MSRAPSRSHDSTTARDITHQQERSSLQMSPRNLAPKSKSKEFTGFAGEIPPRLQPSEAKNVAKRSEQGGTLSKRSSLFSWLEYPPNFEKATECRIQVSLVCGARSKSWRTRSLLSLFYAVYPES
eukprot:14107-Pelagococcus_subviridis.AAC.1